MSSALKNLSDFSTAHLPDVSQKRFAIIVSEWNGRSAEEVERFVTTPVEIAMSAILKIALKKVKCFCHGSYK